MALSIVNPATRRGTRDLLRKGHVMAPGPSGWVVHTAAVAPLSTLCALLLQAATTAGEGDGAGVLVVSPRDAAPLTTSAARSIVLDGEELARTGERSLPRAIARAAGVFLIESNLGGGAPVLRGLLGNQVLVLVDGVRLNDSTTRLGPNQSLNTIDPAIVERVEVRMGTSSVLYGSDAIGGVIAVWTKRRAPAADASVEGGVEVLHDTATRGWRGALQLSGAGERHGWIGVLSGAEWDDLVAGGGERQEETGYHTGAGFGSFEWALDEGRTLRASTWVNRDFDVPRTFQVVPGFGQSQATFERYDFALQEREQSVLTLEDDLDAIHGDRLQARLFARSYREQRARRRTGSASEVFGETDTDSVGLGFDLTRRIGPQHRLTYGVEFIHDDVDSFNRRTNTATGVVTPEAGDFRPGSRYASLGLFVQDEVSTFDPVLLTAGLRYSRFDFAFDGAGGRERGGFDDLTGSVEAAYDIDPGARITATVAQGFQAPNLEDLANDGDFAGGTELANPDLQPAESLMLEVGVDVQRRTYRWHAAAFSTRIDDVLGRRLLDAGDPNQAGDEVYQRINDGRLHLWGCEVGGDVALGGADSPWSAEGVVSWVRGRQYDDELGDVDARRIPPLHGRLGLLWRPLGDETVALDWLDEARLAVAFSLRQDALHPDDLTDPRIDPTGTDGWQVWTLDAGGPLSRSVRWSGSLVNLFDEAYRAHGAGIDGPGRSLVVSLRATF